MSYHPGSGFSSLTKYFLQEHEQGQEESLSTKEGKKWIIREEKQQQEEKYQQGKKDEQEQVSKPP